MDWRAEVKGLLESAELDEVWKEAALGIAMTLGLIHGPC
jgi:uncharacterized membrane protein YhiD involved in acid resistance